MLLFLKINSLKQKLAHMKISADECFNDKKFYFCVFFTPRQVYEPTYVLKDTPPLRCCTYMFNNKMKQTQFKMRARESVDKMDLIQILWCCLK